MSTAAAAGMQAALLIREKQRLRRKKFRKGRSELPSHVATREIGPFPQYPPGFLSCLLYGIYFLHGPIFHVCWQCSQGRAAWQERERGRRCSLSEEARQHRIKQTEAHHRWMKRNRIHDSTYGGGSDDEDFFSVYHQSAAANALLYVGLGTTAIGSVIFFVGTGEKGFKTLELRLIGPTLIACGLLCCLIRVLLCACPSTCLRRRKKTRLKNNACPHSSSRYPLAPKYRDARDADFVHVDKTALLSKHKKKVSIGKFSCHLYIISFCTSLKLLIPPNHSLPSTSTTEFKEFKEPRLHHEEEKTRMPIPQIQLPELPSFSEEGGTRMSRDDSIIELQTLDLSYDIQSVSSNDSDSITVIETEKTAAASKLARPREPSNIHSDNIETCLSVVIERNDNSEGSEGTGVEKKDAGCEKQTHSGIVLSPLQLGQ
ncbi:hypothetical protein NQ315_001752 [Exocentrus adspersus]|uniref:Uncharacterized protein n=1 Tax=Exocentrus adspersus TaxID=1586481 RepID=A0AAV8W9C9_9CUCU|nr:hypothetical protein NQ315_001752 [Exocentrus adspersus]